MAGDRISFSTALEYYTEYVVISIPRSGLNVYADIEEGVLNVGDSVSFAPKRTWGIDHPIGIIVFKGNEKIGECNVLGLDIVFCLGLEHSDYTDKGIYRLALPEDADAIFAGVPIEDVFV